MINEQVDKELIFDETLNMYEKVSTEYLVPKPLTCIHSIAFGLLNIAELYKSDGKKVPVAIVKFLDVTYPKLLKDHKNTIEKHFLALNTDGTA